MQIKLKWVNKNDNAAVVEVFRSTAAIDTANPGTPLVTLPGTVSTYTDTTALLGVQYYYAVAVSKNAKKIFTPVKTFTNVARRGHGSNQLLYGDDRLGYFGKIGPDDFIDPARCVGYGPTYSAAFRTDWHKFIRKGKIIFLADRPMIGPDANTAVWGQDLRRSKGLVSGLTWNFSNPQYDAAKTWIVPKDSDNYHFRALRCLPDDWDGTAPTAEMVADPTTEFNELMTTVIVGSYIPSKIGCLRGNQTRTVDMSSIICAEMQGGKHLVRAMVPQGSSPTTSWTGARPYLSTKDSFLLHRLDTESTSRVSYAPWDFPRVWPAFELIE